jgi:hypothetical protein
MKDFVTIFCHVALCSPYVNRRFAENIMSIFRFENQRCKEGTYGRWSAVIRTTGRCIADDGNVHIHRCENLKSQMNFG